jgi:hypothetical protein
MAILLKKVLGILYPIFSKKERGKIDAMFPNHLSLRGGAATVAISSYFYRRFPRLLRRLGMTIS